MPTSRGAWKATILVLEALLFCSVLTDQQHLVSLLPALSSTVLTEGIHDIFATVACPFTPLLACDVFSDSENVVTFPPKDNVGNMCMTNDQRESPKSSYISCSRLLF
jgi:hypothetical protein